MREVIENVVMYGAGVGMFVGLGMAIRGFLQWREWERQQSVDRVK